MFAEHDVIGLQHVAATAFVLKFTFLTSYLYTFFYSKL